MPSTPQPGGVASVQHCGGLGLPASYGGGSPLAPYTKGLSTAPNSIGMVHVAVNHSVTSALQSVPYAAPTAYFQTVGLR
jgi:hypothetical protein